ncbi:MAG: fibronectin type III-like domain-contianing protein, partial [Bacteroidales bacterium]|nr:fibronectin type III-like domain-contianing protein [Bacteroidales bacterium]
YGLSYTDFAYSNATVENEGDGFKVSVTVTNTGAVAGKDVVELFVTAPKGKLEKPAVELKGFAKTKELKPGQSQTLTIVVPAYDLASYDEKACSWITDKGTYTLRLSKDASTAVETLTWKAPKRLSWKTLDILKPVEKINELSLKK